jgi:hypothetical protein
MSSSAAAATATSSSSSSPSSISHSPNAIDIHDTPTSVLPTFEEDEKSGLMCLRVELGNPVVETLRGTAYLFRQPNMFETFTPSIDDTYSPAAAAAAASTIVASPLSSPSHASSLISPKKATLDPRIVNNTHVS